MFSNRKSNSNTFHKVPYPSFEWKKDEDFSMIWSCLSHLIGTVNSTDFIILLSGLLLESKILIYGKDIQKVSSIVLALHYLLIPMKWSFSSVSILPNDGYEFLDSPFPYIYGIDQKNRSKSIGFRSNFS
jgi:hypothetical protein